MSTVPNTQPEHGGPGKKSPTTRKSRIKPQLRFIHTIGTSNHAGKMDPSNLSLIRSHVAKDRHTRRRRQQKKASSEAILLINTESEPPTGHRTKSIVSTSVMIGPGANDLFPSGQREDQPEYREWSFEASPLQYVGGGRKEASQSCFVWSLSSMEHFLFDFYYNCVLTKHYRGCVKQHLYDRFAARMRLDYVPWAISEPGLLAALFYVASIKYVQNYDNEISRQLSSIIMKYKLKCLGEIRSLIAGETVSSDTTISLVILLAAEANHAGKMSECNTHLSAIRHMVRGRGGLNALGLSGFLSFVLVSSFLCAGSEVGDLTMGFASGPPI
ncbi:hypothetical protein BX600DRAFT_493647, partial [Xylariales sp. PMI_506]